MAGHSFWIPNTTAFYRICTSAPFLHQHAPKKRSRQAEPANPQQESAYPPDALEFAVKHLGFQPDPVQQRLLREASHRVILNCTRQWGKSTVAAIKALHHALTHPGSAIAICCPSARQSAELLRKIETFARKLDIQRRSDGVNDISFLFPNRSRIIGLPGRDTTIRGVSAVSLLIVDEASHVPDSLYNAVRPMLAAVSDNYVWLLSPPGDRTGFFFHTWTATGSEWTRVAIPATQCKRISRKYIEEERARMTASDFAREYLCEFTDPNDAMFPSSLVQEALAPIPQLDFYQWQQTLNPPLIKDPDLRRNLDLLFNRFPKPPVSQHFYCGLDLGMRQSHSVLTIIERSLVVSGDFDHATFDFPRKPRWAIRYLKSYPLETEYTDIVPAVSQLLRHPILENQATLTVDATGVGLPVYQLFQQSCRSHARVCSLTIGSGDTATHRNNHFSVPRTHLLNALLLKLQNRDLLLSDTLPEAPALIEELRSIRNQASLAPDDRVFATAIALWPSI